MKKILFKLTCLICCAFVFVSAMPHTGMAGIYESAKGGVYIMSARCETRFRPCSSESLSHGSFPDKGLWITNDESQVYTDRSKELANTAEMHSVKPGENYALLRTVFDNHLSYCKREVYHLLI